MEGQVGRRGSSGARGARGDPCGAVGERGAEITSNGAPSRRFSVIGSFLRTPLRACKTRCRRLARRAAAGAAVLVLLALAKRIMMERCAMAPN